MIRKKIIHHEFIINCLLVCTSILFVLIAIEAGLRLVNYNPFGEFFESEGRAIFIRPAANKQRQYEAVPNASGYGWETTIQINSHGFRGREYSKTKKPGTFRIVVIGDSITFGNRLTQDQNYPAVLEALYQRKGQPVEVLNLGLGGYDTLQEVATLADIGLAFDPDLVILGYCINDIGIASGNRQYVERLQQYGRWMYRSRLLQWIRVHADRILLKQAALSSGQKESFSDEYKDYLADISQDENLLQQMKTLRELIDARETKFPYVRDYTSDVHLQRLRFALEQLRGLQRTKTDSFDVLVLNFPFLLQDEKSRPVFQTIDKIIAHEAGRLGFKVVNLYPIFASEELGQLLITPDDGIHPNARAHRLVAETLINTISTDNQSKTPH